MAARAQQRLSFSSAASGSGSFGSSETRRGVTGVGSCRMARSRQDDDSSFFSGEGDDARHRRIREQRRRDQERLPQHRYESSVIPGSALSCGRYVDPIDPSVRASASTYSTSSNHYAPRHHSNSSRPYSTRRSSRASYAYCASSSGAGDAEASSPSSTSPRSVVTLTGNGDGSPSRSPPFDPPFGECGRRAVHGGCSAAGFTESTTEKSRPIEIEIEPGLYSVLRGSDETWEAILDDMYMPSPCPWCQLTVFAIQDCGYVLCPECKAVFPVDDNNGCLINRVASGVGLGFTFESLIKWQPDVDECRRSRRHEQPQR